MATITGVSLSIQHGGPTAPTSLRRVDVITTISFTQQEISSRASFTEDITLYGSENNVVDYNKKLVEFPSARQIIAQQYQQTEYYTGYVQRQVLDEDPDITRSWYQQCIHYNQDEIAVQVCLSHVQTTRCCATSPCVQIGDWGAAGVD